MPIVARMAVEAIIARYGLLAVLLGAGMEGEAVVVTAGVLAHRHLLPLWPTALAAAIGSCAVDQIWFLLGRHFRNHRWVRHVRDRPAYARAITILERYPNGFIFGFRFVYGLRTVSPIAIGTSHIAARRFILLNIVAAAIWGPAFTLLGYMFGPAVDPILSRFERGGRLFVFAALGALAVALLWTAIRSARGRRTPPDDTA
ncbi:MAG TPA: DedA family protein [Sphingomonas sp.]